MRFISLPSVCQWEIPVTLVIFVIDVVAVSDGLKIIGKTGTSPDEFQVQLPLQICEAFKNLPELHNLRILRIATL
jgi:hypothetical protein